MNLESFKERLQAKTNGDRYAATLEINAVENYNKSLKISDKFIASTSNLKALLKSDPSYKESLKPLEDAILNNYINSRAKSLFVTDGGLMYVASHIGYMGGGMMMLLRDAGAPTMPLSLAASVGGGATSSERESGKATHSILNYNVFFEAEIGFVSNISGRRKFTIHQLSHEDDEIRTAFMTAQTTGAVNFAHNVLKESRYEIKTNLLGASTREFINGHYVSEGEVGVKGVLLAPESETGSIDFIRPLVVMNPFDGEHKAVPFDNEMRGINTRDLSTTGKSLDRTVVYFYGNDLVVTFKGGEISYEGDIGGFLNNSGIIDAIRAGKSTGLTGQSRALLRSGLNGIASGKNLTGYWPETKFEWLPKLREALLDAYRDTNRPELAAQVMPRA
ncbi:MAG: hypothetical protein KGH54_03685 [Candidatus Micrarchaeota archaeon]|nr:hypothetical protein [Candidatus Micrarchaeota archaeon]